LNLVHGDSEFSDLAPWNSCFFSLHQDREIVGEELQSATPDDVREKRERERPD
jgi:hypothetical protein